MHKFERLPAALTQTPMKKIGGVTEARFSWGFILLVQLCGIILFMFSRSSLNTEVPTWEKKIGQVISVTFNFVAKLFSELHGVLLE